MNSFQESKNELEAAIRYAENAISAAQTTIESMQFRQDMAKKEYEERTGREQALERELEERIAEVADLKVQIEGHRTNMALLTDEVEKFRKEKEASSGPCGCQAYRDIEERTDSLSATIQRLKKEHAQEVANLKECLKIETAALDRLREDTPIMPVIPKDVAIAIFREGIATGVLSACSEIEGQTINICENEYCGDFEVTFARDIHLDDELDLDLMRDKCGDYTEDAVIDSLKGLCADNKFECRIHGVDDNED